ncbi:helix-turn-helix domain-containing protein [Actinomycetospora chiangmaiensis]|uniref:helix-turn-helix domain-containing protein n=1 Tax=Actinomycetospora chiangmaiensis TaxID=402650 RepID=UPI000365C741|nr:helix-turn-helix domain-containing protein [Actinomycetospora chiangmaiensis]
MSTVGRHDLSAPAPARSTATRAVVTALAGVAPPARDRDAGAEAAAIVRWAGVRHRHGALAADLDTPEAASRLVSLLTRLGADDGTVAGDSARGRWRVEVGPDTDSGDSLAVRLGVVDNRGRPLAAPPDWLTGGSLPGAIATWRGALLARGEVVDGAVTLDCPAPGAARVLTELGLRLGVRARRPGSGSRLTVTDPAEAALLLTTCGGRVTAAAAGLADATDAAAPGSANDARATVAASRAAAAVAEAFATLERAGVEVPDARAAAGRLRLAHPHLGLPELAARAAPPMSKDALAGRLRRLLTLAARHR